MLVMLQSRSKNPTFLSRSSIPDGVGGSLCNKFHRHHTGCPGCRGTLSRERTNLALTDRRLHDNTRVRPPALTTDDEDTSTSIPPTPYTPPLLSSSTPQPSPP